MKLIAFASILAQVLCLVVLTSAELLVSHTPVAKVVELLVTLKQKVEEDGRAEQRSFDEYACWCERTIANKTKVVAEKKVAVDKKEREMQELEAVIASLGAEIKNLEADIGENIESQREATEVREKESTEYDEEKSESEQCIGSLEAAIGVLAGAGGGTQGFLETFQEARLLSVAAGIQRVLKSAPMVRSFSDKDLQVVRQFAQKPEDFVGGRAVAVSVAQMAKNPFGDYAPQSTQIQGVLKGMYDAFAAGLEKANAEEADQQKAFEVLMATKQEELQTLNETHNTRILTKAAKTDDLAVTTLIRDDAKAELKATKAFVAALKTAFRKKTWEWSTRERLRTEEILGMNKAIRILSNRTSQEVFRNATTNFMQLSAQQTAGHRDGGRAKAFARLKALAQQSHSLGLAKLAVEVMASGHFDNVIASIDRMIALLRKEEQADIEHRDRCQGSQNKNKNDIEDLTHVIDKSATTLQRMQAEKQQLMQDIAALQDAITQANNRMVQQLQQRNDEVALFEQIMKDDTDAVALLDTAILILTKFYKRNKIPLGFAQGFNYTVDPDKAPDTIWTGPNYGGRKSETEGIIAILAMIKEDLEKEMQVSKKGEASAQAAYLEGRAAAQAMLNALTTEKTAMEKELVGLQEMMLGTENDKTAKTRDKDAEKELESALYLDCSWVDTHFDIRRQQRRDEMNGLVDAKSYLAGVESGDEVTP